MSIGIWTFLASIRERQQRLHIALIGLDIGVDHGALVWLYYPSPLLMNMGPLALYYHGSMLRIRIPKKAKFFPFCFLLRHLLRVQVLFLASQPLQKLLCPSKSGAKSCPRFHPAQIRPPNDRLFCSRAIGSWLRAYPRPCYTRCEISLAVFVSQSTKLSASHQSADPDFTPKESYRIRSGVPISSWQYWGQEDVVESAVRAVYGAGLRAGDMVY
ncbi:hypothetical protein C8J56DRAFT_1118719 [Mycena floridula]|nr:hypothetical protein C8J56DRAFT_1118719 [Mycena floridula]